MTTMNSEVWLLVFGIESGRASSFRQERWCRIFFELGVKLRIFNLGGAFNITEIECSTDEELTTFIEGRRACFHGIQSSVREGLISRLLRRLKHFLLADLYLPNVIHLYRRLNKLITLHNQRIILMASSPPFSRSRWPGQPLDPLPIIRQINQQKVREK